MSRNGNGLLILIITVTVIALATFLLINKSQKLDITPSPTSPTEQSTLTPSSNKIKVYVNKTYGYSFEYPLTFEIKELGNAVHGYSRGDNFEFIYYGKEGIALNNQDKALLEAGPKITIDGRLGYITHCDTGCAEGGEESLIQIDVYDRLHFQFIFHGVKELSDTDKQILSSFKFGKAS